MKQLKFAYKGTRTYIQGPDILNAVSLSLEEQVGGLQSIDFSMRSICTSNVIGLQEGVFGPEAKGAIGHFECSTKNEVRQFLLYSLEAETEVRVPFDESSVLEGCTYDELLKRVTLDSACSLSSEIETIVSLNKALHLRLHHGQQIKWLFVRFQSDRWPLSTGNRGQWLIRQTEALGTRLTKSQVYFNDEPMGTIWFSGVVEKK